jgi:hypothetical protein
VDVVNGKLENQKTRMRLRLNLENLASHRSALEELLDTRITLEYTAIGLQDVVREIARQANLYAMYGDDVITLIYDNRHPVERSGK